MELALMAGGHSLPENPKEVNYTFIKELPTLGHVSRHGYRRPDE